MVPINVTHTAIVTKSIHSLLLDPSSNYSKSANSGVLPLAKTPLRHTLSTLISFFAATYEAVFGFVDGPPLHDPLAIAMVAYPSLFKCKRYRVDVECQSALTSGETVVDIWNYRKCDDSWGKEGCNCLVAESLDVCDVIFLLHDN